MCRLAFVVMFLFVSNCFASPQQKTVSQCAKDLSRAVLGLEDKKCEHYCKKYSQETVDCAIEDYRMRGLGRTFENALEDCERPQDNK